LKGSDDRSLNAHPAIQGDASNCQSPTSQQLAKPSEALALKWFYMLFHKNNLNKFITAGKKLKTKTFESFTKFL
jgi:hypothetical protein